MKSKKIIALILCVAALLAATMGVLATPGTDSDPLISLSYVKDVLMPELKAYIDEKIAEIVPKSESGNSSSSVFEIINLKAGEKIICDKSCEMILRMGAGTIISTEKGGIADATAGCDLANGAPIPSNHLLIVPLDDGRGISMETDGIVMIKGTYLKK